ncbi:MAG: apolipoprotein N-acyltransferase [Methylohalobius sp.]|nr:apolipoprotein N-acyltransferase [Methylohalobius sp.]
MRINFWPGLLLALLAGALFPLAFAPYSQGWLAPLLLAVLFGLWHSAPSPRFAFGQGYLFGLGQFGFGVWWVYISMHQYSGAGVLEASALTVLLVAFLALYPALAGWVAVQLCEHRAWVWQKILGWPSIWVALEWLRGWLFTGFPWLEVGYSQIDTPLAGFGPVFGEYGVGWLAAFTAAVLQTVWQRRQAGRWMAIAVLLWFSGWGLKSLSWVQPAGEPIRAALLQGNIPQDLKWQSETQAWILATYLEMTRRHWDKDLIIWPETAVPAFYHQVYDDWLSPLAQEAKAHESDVLVGVPVVEASGRYYNALINLKNGEVYYKRHLVPFGEFLPLRMLLGFIVEVLEIPLSDFSAGKSDQALLNAAGFSLAVTICYEDAFARDALVGLPQAAYLVNVSNDAWFGDTAASYQHLQMARMRALEGGRYLLRATNTGLTAVIGPNGQVIAQAAPFVRTSLTASIVPLAGATPYVIWRDWPLLLGIMAVLSQMLIQRVDYTSLRARINASWKSK